MSRLNPPMVENIIAAQTHLNQLTIPFSMNRSVGWEDFETVQLIVKTVQTNVVLATAECNKNSISKKDNIYQAIFVKDDNFPLQIGQYYKIQLAYINKSNEIGFYSSAATFKFTSSPEVIIQGLDDTDNFLNPHTYDYVGSYSNPGDPSEKVYSYRFDLYDRHNTLVVSSGDQLHNSSEDRAIDKSIDKWTTRQGLQPGFEYLLSYTVKTINGLEISSKSYRIIDGHTVPSNLSKYYDFIATNNADCACVELSIQPKKDAIAADRKLINGKFLITRASSEDNFQSWNEMTRFVLASWDSSRDKFLCNDYSVAQGETYIYALQAYNNNGVYTTRQETPELQVDFEDMFLSDGERQLKIRFNPKVSSFKTTLLESKMDTLGGKYPFFFRNGNVSYKEFPISGLISMLMDDNHEFIQGISLTDKKRTSTPAAANDYQDLQTALTGSNFKKERDFKLEVLNWLTNGKPKLFRSPGEGNYIIRLMNTSLSPNDTLGRMLHTFSSTAYEMADYTFENLRKYKMVMDEYIELRELKSFSKNLYLTATGGVSGLNACMATVRAYPGTEFHFKLVGDSVEHSIVVGPTGIYNFPPELLKDTPLLEVYHKQGVNGWFPEATLIYSTYVNQQIDSFSYIHSIDIKDQIGQWIGRNRSEIDSRFGTYPLKKSIGLIYYLNIQKKDIIVVDEVEQIGVNTYSFKINGATHTPTPQELVYHEGVYYDGRTRGQIGEEPNYNIRLRKSEQFLDFQGTGSLEGFTGCEGITATGGRVVLTNVSDVDDLYLGNGIYADIAYQEITKIYTVEETPGTVVNIARNEWLESGLDGDYEHYYRLLEQEINKEQEGLIVDAL